MRHALGAPDAPVTLVEYGDFECPNCKQAETALTILLAHHGARLRLVWRNFPLEEVHPRALDAALAAEAAGAQGRFWPMHDLLFANQRHLGRADLRGYANRLELDTPRYEADMGDTVYLQRVREDIEDGRASGVRSTPAFFLNGVVHDASFGMERLFRDVEAELGAARRA